MKTEKIKKVIKTPKKTDYSAIYEKSKTYAAEEALEIVKKLTKTKFDASIEVHMRLGINTKKGDQQVRGQSACRMVPEKLFALQLL
jgi:large subunit ribosomal protein L1